MTVAEMFKNVSMYAATWSIEEDTISRSLQILTGPLSLLFQTILKEECPSAANTNLTTSTTPLHRNPPNADASIQFKHMDNHTHDPLTITVHPGPAFHGSSSFPSSSASKSTRSSSPSLQPQ